MIEIIATAAVSGIAGTAIGFSLARPWQDWTIKRDIERDLVRNRLRKLLEEARGERDEAQAAYMDNLSVLAGLKSALAATGKPDTQAVSDYMREIGARGNASPKRMSSKALATAGAAIEKRAKKASAEQREAA